jgi:hypothetical protein
MILNLKIKMNKKLFTYLSVLCLIWAMFSGCANPKSVNEENKVEFDTIAIDKTYYLMENKDNPNCDLQIKFVYPSSYSDKKILTRMQEAFVSQYFGDTYTGMKPKDACQQYAKDYLEAYKDLEEDFQNELKNDPEAPVQSWFSYYETSSDRIVFNKAKLISFEISFENYTGGAHGSHSYQNRVINLANGSVLTEEEIFVPNYQEELSAILVDKIVEQNGLKDAKELENLGFFSVDEIVPNSNFLVTEEGLTYTFNEYEIAAYAVGAINVFIPFKDLRFLIRENSPIHDLLQNN